MKVLHSLLVSLCVCCLMLSADYRHADASTRKVGSLVTMHNFLQPVPQGKSGLINPAALFAVELGRRRIAIFDAHGNRIGSIQTAIGLMATDPQGNLYLSVVNEYAEDIKIYTPPYGGKPELVNLPGQLVGGIAVDQKTEVFAVMSRDAKQGGGASEISFFRHGETKVCNIIREPAGITAFGNFLAFDREGNLFFSISEASGYQRIASIEGQCTAKAVRTYAPHKVSLFNLAFNAQDQLVVQESLQNNSYPVLTYAHPARGSLGSPMSTTVLPAVNGFVPRFETLTNDGKRLLANYASESIGVYDYPRGGPPTRHIEAFRPIYSTVFPELIP